MAILIKSQGPNHFYDEDDGDQEQQQHRVDIKNIECIYCRVLQQRKHIKLTCTICFGKKMIFYTTGSGIDT